MSNGRIGVVNNDGIIDNLRIVPFRRNPCGFWSLARFGGLRRFWSFAATTTATSCRRTASKNSRSIFLLLTRTIITSRRRYTCVVGRSRLQSKNNFIRRALNGVMRSSATALAQQVKTKPIENIKTYPRIRTFGRRRSASRRRGALNKTLRTPRANSLGRLARKNQKKRKTQKIDLQWQEWGRDQPSRHLVRVHPHSRGCQSAQLHHHLQMV
jgi:hypothetical protein